MQVPIAGNKYRCRMDSWPSSSKKSENRHPQTGKTPDILRLLASLSAYLAQVINLNSCS